MTMGKPERFKLRGPSAVETSVATAGTCRLQHMPVSYSATPAWLHAPTAGEATPDHGPRNDHLGSHFPHTLEPAA